MTGSAREEDGRPAASSGNVEALARAVSLSLVPALVWAIEVTVRFGASGGVLSTFTAVLGSAALTLGSVAVLARRIDGAPALESLVQGALLASWPISALAAVLAVKTHHRALGGVTFAIVAVVLVALGALLAGRLSSFRRAGTPWGRRLRFVLAMSMALSCGLSLWPLLSALSPAAPLGARLAAEDVAMAFVLSGSMIATRRVRVPPPWSRRGALLWGGAVVLGSCVAAFGTPLRALLSDRAPIALGTFGLLGR